MEISKSLAPSSFIQSVKNLRLHLKRQLVIFFYVSQEASDHFEWHFTEITFPWCAMASLCIFSIIRQIVLPGSNWGLQLDSWFLCHKTLLTEIINFPMTFSCEHDPSRTHVLSRCTISRFVVWIFYITYIDMIKVLTDVSIIFDVLPQISHELRWLWWPLQLLWT